MKMQKIKDELNELKKRKNAAVCAYIYDLKGLKQHVHSVVHSLPTSCHMYYAVKANADPAILETMASEVHGFEAASLGEIEKIRQISKTVPILMGGPGKTDEELIGAVTNKVEFIHIESIHELRRLQWIANKLNEKVSILLRVNLRNVLPQATLQMGGRPTQFGIDEYHINEAIQFVKDSSSTIQLRGFHLHSISNQMNANDHIILIQHYLNKVQTWEREHNIQVDHINVGGGIGVNYQELDTQFNWSSFTVGLEDLLKQKAAEGKRIVFECGRYLSAFCGYYAAEVLDLKNNHGGQYAILKGGTQHFRLPVSWQHNHPFRIMSIQEWKYPFPRHSLNQQYINLVGQLCTPKDIFARDVFVEHISIGDIIVFEQAGAYGWAISHHDFLSHPNPDFIYLR
jgi:diaminopimelate decarboxylase